MNSKEYKTIILQTLKEYLHSKGFKKKGNNFILSTSDLIYYIGLQSSQSSTSSILKITVNTEIASTIISKVDEISLPINHQRHYTRRIGAYSVPATDRWWIIENREYAERAASEITSLLEMYVLPTFDSLKTTEDLVRLWISDSDYIGITEGQRKHYLSLLGY